MHRVAAALAVVLLALALPGCSGPKEGADPPKPDANGAVTDATGNVTLALPPWAVGDAWAYGLEVAATGEEGVTAYVVTEDLGTDWRIDTDSDERAFQDARDDVSRLGPQRKTDLAGSQGSDRVEFFRWPLTAGATWTTRWDHQEVTVRVHGVDARGARLTASNATQTVYDYTYDAAAGWFGGLTRHAPDGSAAVKLTLLSSAHDWTGTVIRYALTPLAEGTAANAPGTANYGPDVAVPAGLTDLWLSYQVACGNGVVAIDLAPQPPASNPGYSHRAPCAAPLAFAGVAATDPPAGPWAFGIAFADGSQAPNGIDAHWLLLGRTRTDVKVG